MLTSLMARPDSTSNDEVRGLPEPPLVYEAVSTGSQPSQ